MNGDCLGTVKQWTGLRSSVQSKSRSVSLKSSSTECRGEAELNLSETYAMCVLCVVGELSRGLTGLFGSRPESIDLIDSSSNFNFNCFMGEDSFSGDSWSNRLYLATSLVVGESETDELRALGVI